ncbi:MAG: DUF502 domain-containing protein [Planctomycetota bacterium]
MRQISFLRTTAIGGIFFLLPFAVVCVLLGQVAQVVYAVAVSIQPYILPYWEVTSATAIALIGGASVALIIGMCFLCGLIARRSLARQFTRRVEKYLLMLFPRYAIFKEQLSGNIGGAVAKNRLRPIVVELPGEWRLAFEVERADPAWQTQEAAQTHPATVTVFLPGSPDPWNGSVISVRPDQVRNLTVEFSDVLGAYEKLGADTQRLLAGLKPH